MGNLCSSESSSGEEVRASVTANHKGGTSKPSTPKAGGAAKDAGQAKSKQQGTWIIKPTPDIRTEYDFGKVLGKGQFGTTRLAINKKTGDKYACKSISKRKLVSKDDIEDVKREVQIMYHLAGHPNVVKLVGVFEDRQHVHLVMELCSGGELFDRIIQRGHYTEKDASQLIRTIVTVVAHCHAMGVIHRDLKPENFLLSDSSDNAILKATDFGLSVFFKEGQLLRDIVGSAYYVAPEVLHRRYSKEADIWSCGVMLYILLCGVPPFYGDNEQQIFDAVLRGTPDFESEPWPRVSAAAKDCVRRMLVRDPSKRATAEEILRHDWMRVDGVASDNPLEFEVVNRIKGFAAMNRLKKEALKIIAGNLPVEEITGLKEMFLAMDADKSGTITVDELKEGLSKMGTRIPDAELQRIMVDADVNGDGTIDYEEFLAATMNLGKLEREENLYLAFRHFDADNSGYITKEELVEALTAGASGPDELKAIDEIIKEVDKDNDGRIDYEEFCNMMRGNAGSDIVMAATTVKSGIVNAPK